jgi:hypothetical protein
MLFHRWAYDGFLNPQCKLVKEKEKEKEPLMPVRSHQHLSLSLSPCLSLSSSHCSHTENAQGMNAASKLWQDRHTESKVQMQAQVILNLIS